MLKHLQAFMKNVEDLNDVEITIKAEGNYPTKVGTPVQDVAHYQNDGTTKGVKPSRFVQRAEKTNRSWAKQMQRAIDEYFDGDDKEMHRLGRRIAQDIMAKIDRIKTGRLKRSVVAEIDGP